MIELLGLHAVIGAIVFAFGARLGRSSFLVAAIGPLATLVWLATQLSDVLDGRATTQRVTWVSQLGLGIDLRLDGFAALMVLLIAGIGLAVCVYSVAYFAPHHTAPGGTEGHASDPDPGEAGRYAGLLVLFAAAMLCLVLADNLLVLYTGWELTSVTSYLLIGNNHTSRAARAAALQALLITSAGGLAMLGGFVLIGEAAGTFRLSAILANPPSGTAVSVGVVLVLFGAFTKSAQYPFHSWLPGAMTAPTPVSAYLHSATMVKAGVYLIGRFAPAFATVGIWRPLVLTVGAVTMIAGGLRALRQHDLKLLLAFGTVSQLGFLVVLFGAGTAEATTAGCVMLLAHALFKAVLFMSVGVVDHVTGTRDLRRIPALGAGWRTFRIVTVAAAASMAGVPLLAGFIGKEAGLEALHHGGFAGHGWVLGAVVVGSVLTAAYTARFVWGMFGPVGSRAGGATAGTPRTDRLAATFLAPIGALGLVSVVIGLTPGVADRLVGAAAHVLDPLAHSPHLALWHGWTVPLLLSAVALAGGAVLFVGRRPLDPLLAVGARVPTGSRIYGLTLRGVNNGATRLTGLVQNGSLPVYAGVTLLTAAVAPGIVLLSAAAWPGWPQLIGSGAQVPVVVLLLGAALAAAVVRRRFSAALFLGTAGYAMAGLFVVQGAPDLALTQVAIETLSTVLFVLVLRRLPDRFERTSTNGRRVLRVVISALVGLTVFTFAIVARGARTATPVSTEMIERSLPDAHGRNVVNVILVDIRGFDTLGEITVLASAGIGAVAIARAGSGRRRRRAATGASPEVAS